jgi:hypothetical protein
MNCKDLTIACLAVVALTGCDRDNATPAMDHNTNSTASSAVEAQPDSAGLTPPAPGATLAIQPAGTPADSPGANASVTDTRAAYLRLAEQRLGELGAEIDELAEKLQPPIVELQGEVDQSLSALNQQREEAESTLAALLAQQEQLETKFDLLKAATAEVWSNAQTDFEAAMQSLKTAFDNAKSKFSS